MENTNNNPSHNRHDEDTKKDIAIRLFKVLFQEPMSRRMAATKIGFPDQTYQVTQLIFDWVKSGKAQVIGLIKCTRSGCEAEAITTNPDFFIQSSTSQLNLFES